MANEIRIDHHARLDSYEKLSNGFLKVEAFLTRCGVFTYVDEQGNAYQELRHPDDVYEDASLKTLQGLVLTNEHPDEFVNSENCQKYQVGYSDSWLKHDDGRIGSITTWTEKETISQIESGEKRDISTGYTCDVIDESGEWMGIPYVKRQKNIRYNHAALTKMGRAGSSVGVRMDSAGKKVCFLKNDSCNAKTSNLHLNESEGKMTKKIKVDSAEIEVTEEVAAYVEKISTEKTKLDGENAALKSEIEKRDSENKELKKQLSDDEVLKRADSLLKVKDFAATVLKDQKVDGLTIAEMKSKVVAALVKNVDVAKKDSTWIDASFETLMNAERKDAGEAVIEDGKSKEINNSKEANIKEYYKKQDSWSIDKIATV